MLGFIADNYFKCASKDDFCKTRDMANWKWMLLSATPIALVLQLSFIFIAPSSPRFLVSMCELRQG